MADIRINSLPTTASASSSDDFLALDGATNGTRKLNAYSPTFGGNLTVSGTGTSSFGGNLTVGAGSSIDAMLRVYRSVGGSEYMELVANSGGSHGNNQYTLDLIGSTQRPFLIRSSTDGGSSFTNRVSWDLSGNQTLSGNLTVSGGQIALAASASTPSVLITQTDPAQYSVVRLQNTGGTAQSYDFAVGGAGAGSLARKFYIYDGTASATRLAIAPTTGNVLIGTTTDGGQKLQVNGAALLGTDNASLGAYFDYNGGVPGNATLWLKQTTKSSSTYTLTGGGTYTALNAPSGGSIYLRINNSDVLTLDSSQRAQFEGKVTINGANSVLVVKGANPTSSASSTIVDWASNARIISYGSTVGTAAGFNFVGLSSDGSVGGARFTIDSAGDATFTGSVKVSNLLTIQSKDLGAKLSGSSYTVATVTGVGKIKMFTSHNSGDGYIEYSYVYSTNGKALSLINQNQPYAPSATTLTLNTSTGAIETSVLSYSQSIRIVVEALTGTVTL